MRLTRQCPVEELSHATLVPRYASLQAEGDKAGGFILMSITGAQQREAKPI